MHSSEAEFYEALATVRSRFGSESVTEEELWEIVRVEEKRVIDAAVLAELLLPRLMTALRAKSPTTASPTSFDPPTTAPVEPRVAIPAAPPGIADLLEGMLDQQRTEARNRSSSHRS